MSGDDLVMTTADLEQSIRLEETFPQISYGLPLSRAALAGELDLAHLEREFAMPRAWSRSRNMPLVAVITDTVGKPAGPATWRSAAPLAAWADIAVLQRQNSTMGHYRHAAELAKTHMRVLLIETPAETFEDWRALLSARPGLAIELME